jgi:hypothetical protein
MSLPDFERVEKLLRVGSIICGLSLIPRSVAPSSMYFPQVYVTCESAAAFSACLTFWIPCTWLFQVSNISSTLPACASCCRALLSLTITHQLTCVFLALSFFWRRCATRTCILCFICSSEKFTAYFRYFLENFKFLLSYPGRGAFYVFCGSLALANTGEPARCFLLWLWMKLTI